MADLRERLQLLLGQPVLSLERLAGGRNSRVHRAVLANGRSVAAKEYFVRPGDGRDRLGAEFGALAFLRQQGIESVPEPLAREGRDLGVYSFVEGLPAGREPVPGDARAMADFLAGLAALAPQALRSGLPMASDFCLSLEGTLAAVRGRLAKFEGIEKSGARELLDEVARELDRAEAFARKGWEATGLDLAAELPESRWTLSPSDFGLHNALRTASGLVFVDFEFCGLDDPAKMAADLLLHPGIDLGREDAQELAERLALALPEDPGFEARLRAIFGLHGIKWCLIACNELLHGERERRAFAGSLDPDAEGASLGQARNMLAALREADGLWRPPLKERT